MAFSVLDADRGAFKFDSNFRDRFIFRVPAPNRAVDRLLSFSFDGLKNAMLHGLVGPVLTGGLRIGTECNRGRLPHA